MKLYLKLLLCLAFVNMGCSSKLSINKVSKAKLAESKLHHIVLFNFKETAPMDTIEKAMYELFGTIKEILSQK
jgi:hypothetical protein